MRTKVQIRQKLQNHKNKEERNKLKTSVHWQAKNIKKPHFLPKNDCPDLRRKMDCSCSRCFVTLAFQVSWNTRYASKHRNDTACKMFAVWHCGHDSSKGVVQGLYRVPTTVLLGFVYGVLIIAHVLLGALSSLVSLDCAERLASPQREHPFTERLWASWRIHCRHLASCILHFPGPSMLSLRNPSSAGGIMGGASSCTANLIESFRSRLGDTKRTKERKWMQGSGPGQKCVAR